MQAPTDLEPVEQSNGVVDIVEAVAAADGVAATNVEPPLYEAVDPDALDNLLDSGTAEMTVTVAFTYADHHIVVNSDGRLDVS